MFGSLCISRGGFGIQVCALLVIRESVEGSLQRSEVHWRCILHLLHSPCLDTNHCLDKGWIHRHRFLAARRHVYHVQAERFDFLVAFTRTERAPGVASLKGD